MSKRCYFDDHGYCDYTKGLWQCQTCQDWFCHYHWHETSKGKNVECAACEYMREVVTGDTHLIIDRLTK